MLCILSSLLDLFVNVTVNNCQIHGQGTSRAYWHERLLGTKQAKGMKSQEIHVNETTLNCNTAAVTSLLVPWQGMCSDHHLGVPTKAGKSPGGSQQLKVHEL